ncbi:hypothetical protein ZIOFF_008786 [Zingiber officinale]|uniref:Uncharacterized protein n=1 Tax=Zingiber officinale TaxID=94328 RepID=A0A8J5LR19_ZINOF|nr:hypothetical protein ZIOFF_008786 [Zingiber officinale]
MGCVSSGADKMKIPSPLEAHQNLLVAMALCSRWPLSFLPAIDRGTPMDPDQALRAIRIHLCSLDLLSIELTTKSSIMRFSWMRYVDDARKFLNASDLDGFDKCMLKLPYAEIECSAPGPNFQDKDNSFSDSEEEGSSRGRRQKMGDDDTHVESPVLESSVTGFKAIATNASVFSFGDDED